MPVLCYQFIVQCVQAKTVFGKWHRQNVFGKVFKYTEL